MASNTIMDLLVKLGIDTKGFSKGIDNAETKTTGFKRSLESVAVMTTGLSSALNLAEKAIQAVGQMYGDTVGKATAYNKQILDLSVNIGATTDETSRLIQVGDDAGVAQGELTAALQMMTMRGLEPSIDNLAKLADQYVAIKDPTKQAALMQEYLGRSWTTLTPILKTGGAALIANAKAMDGGLIVTQDSAAASEEWRLTLDALNDTIEGTKIALGNKLIPALNSFITNVTTSVTNVARLRDLMISHSKEVLKTAGSYEEYSKELRRAAEVAGYTVKANGDLVGASGRVQEANYLLTQGAYDAAVAEQHFADVVNDFVIPSAQDLALAYAGVIQQYDPLINGFSPIKQLAIDAGLAMQEYSVQLLYAKAAEGLTAGEALTLATQMGLVNEKTVLSIEATNILRQSMADGKTSAEGYALKVSLLDSMLNLLNGKKVSAEVLLTMVAEFIGDMNALDIRSGGKRLRSGDQSEGAADIGGANGLSFSVPSGYSGDSYNLGHVWASSGETVSITPKGGNAYTGPSAAEIGRETALAFMQLGLAR